MNKLKTIILLIISILECQGMHKRTHNDAFNADNNHSRNTRLKIDKYEEKILEYRPYSSISVPYNKQEITSLNYTSSFQPFPNTQDQSFEIDDSNYEIKIAEDGMCLISDGNAVSQSSNETQPQLHGIDGRTLIENTHQWPNCVHGRLSVKFASGKQISGSGTLVGPNHVLTAAHCLYQHGQGWAIEVIYTPAQNGNMCYFGKIKASKLFAFKEWIDSCSKKTGESRFEHDMGMIILNQPIGFQTGWFGMVSASDDYLGNCNVNVTGYPGDKGTTTMWTMPGPLKIVKENIITYDIDTFSGQSGGGIWLQKNENNYAVAGVVSYGWACNNVPKACVNNNQPNGGCRITGDKLNNILQWIADNQLEGNNNPYAQEVDDFTKIFLEYNKKYSESQQYIFRFKSTSSQFLPPLDSGELGVYINNRDKNVYCKIKNEKPIKIEVIEKSGNFFKSIRENIQAREFLTHEQREYLLKYMLEHNYVNSRDRVNTYRLANCYYEGIGVQRDFSKAFVLFSESAVQGYGKALAALGICYERGTGVEKDLVQAFTAYKAADKSNDSRAAYMLGEWYELGKNNTKPDTKEALKYYEKAAFKGHITAQERRVKLLGEQQQKFSELFKRYKESAEKFKVPKAYLRLGECYQEGKGVDRNIDQAIKCYEHIQDIDAEACYKLGVCYEEKNNLTQAAYFFMKSFCLDSNQKESLERFNSLYKDQISLSNLSQSLININPEITINPSLKNIIQKSEDISYNESVILNTIFQNTAENICKKIDVEGRHKNYVHDIEKQITYQIIDFFNPATNEIILNNYLIDGLYYHHYEKESEDPLKILVCIKSLGLFGSPKEEIKILTKSKYHNETTLFSPSMSMGGVTARFTLTKPGE